ncbi:MAG: hypothetical protein IKJ65_07935 [Clostridia bacterium]|nr:hypothetical protein [Clostridia bacterium]
MHKFLRRAFLSALILFSVCVFSCFAEESFSAYVKADKAVVYSSEFLSGKLGTLPNKTIVTVLEHKDGVAKISYKGKIGFVRVRDFATVASVGTLVEAVKDAKVYSKPSYSASHVTVKKGTTMYLLQYENSICAMVEKDGNIGYIHVDDIKKVAPAAVEKEETAVSGITYENFQARVKSSSVKVYAKASTSSKYLGSVKKGVVVNVSAYGKGWAYIELNGNKGYAKISGLERIYDQNSYLTDASLTNEQIVYQFIVKEMKLNKAAACGIIANIKYESGFRTDALGDNGRSYGICQWFSTRWNRLTTFCAKNGYSPDTLEGQLWFMKYELEKHYPMVLNYLKNNVFENEQGAYDAAWYFCYHYEGPANRASVSKTRANYAKNTVWDRYEK